MPHGLRPRKDVEGREKIMKMTLPALQEVTFEDPPSFKVVFLDLWMDYLAEHPRFPVIGVTRDKDGRVQNKQVLRGFLAVAELGPEPCIGVRAMHWVYCVAWEHCQRPNCPQVLRGLCTPRERAYRVPGLPSSRPQLAGHPRLEE